MMKSISLAICSLAFLLTFFGRVSLAEVVVNFTQVILPPPLPSVTVQTANIDEKSIGPISKENNFVRHRSNLANPAKNQIHTTEIPSVIQAIPNILNYHIPVNKLPENFTHILSAIIDKRIGSISLNGIGSLNLINVYTDIF